MRTGLIINLGLPKSGTTTLARALRRAGLKTADYRIRPKQTENPELHGQFIGELLYRGYFHTGDPLNDLSEFQALSEISVLRGERSFWPQTDWALLDAIRAHHPQTRFVASWRQAPKMSDSMLRWSNLGTERLPGANVPGLPKGFGGTSSERERWIEGHYAALRRHFAGDTQFLEYDTAATASQGMLARFIGVDLPWWGRANATTPRDVA